MYKLVYAFFLSVIDSASDSHQVCLAKDEKTAFLTRYGLFKYTVLPLELCNAPSTYQRLISGAMGEYIVNFVLVYLDDILVFSTTEYKHEHHLGLFSRN